MCGDKMLCDEVKWGEWWRHYDVVTTDLMIHHKEDHLLVDRGWPWVTHTVGKRGLLYMLLINFDGYLRTWNVFYKDILDFLFLVALFLLNYWLFHRWATFPSSNRVWKNNHSSLWQIWFLARRALQFSYLDSRSDFFFRGSLFHTSGESLW